MLPVRDLQKGFFMLHVPGRSEDSNMRCALHVRARVGAFSRFPQQRNRNSGAARYIIHIQPNLISVSDPPAMMAFEGPLLSRVLAPAPSARGRSVYCYVAFMHEPSRFHCHEHMTNYAGREAPRAF